MWEHINLETFVANSFKYKNSKLETNVTNFKNISIKKNSTNNFLASFLDMIKPALLDDDDR